MIKAVLQSQMQQFDFFSKCPNNFFKNFLIYFLKDYLQNPVITSNNNATMYNDFQLERPIALGKDLGDELFKTFRILFRVNR